ncbi:MAG: PD40 domain-containing protein, partial [Myxococcales bacterium]|nr:PD40 domain-containing protein [Myxococcales bacterium]
MNSDGSGQRRLTFAGSYNTEPDFGPNGLIVFSTQIDGKYDILTVDMAGNLQRITQDQGSNQSPTWSPDGRYIAFVSNRGGKRRIWIATADGRFQMPITEKSGGYRSLAWSR